MTDLNKYYSKLEGAELKAEQSKLKAIEYINEEVDGFIFDLKQQLQFDYPALTRIEINEIVKEVVEEYI